MDQHVAQLEAKRRLNEKVYRDTGSCKLWRVRLKGLHDAAHLNGREGTRQGWDESTGRYSVKLDDLAGGAGVGVGVGAGDGDGDGTVVAVKEANIEYLP